MIKRNKNQLKAKFKKKNSFNGSFNTLRFFILRITAGSLLHSIGAADWNARSPSVKQYLVLGGTSNSVSLDLKEYKLHSCCDSVSYLTTS